MDYSLKNNNNYYIIKANLKDNCVIKLKFSSQVNKTVKNKRILIDSYNLLLIN
jgi:hypothetical protein